MKATSAISSILKIIGLPFGSNREDDMPEFTIPCIRVSQRHNDVAPKFAIFAAPAGEIRQWAGVKRRTEDAGGNQRGLNKAKLSALRSFLEKDNRNTIPPAITITLRVDEKNFEAVDEVRHFYVMRLNVPENPREEDKPGLIIDGQHRLFGIAEYDPACLVNVVALLEGGDLEAAFQFLVINNKVTPVPPDHIRTLVLDYQEDELAERLKAARLTVHANLPFVGTMDTDELSPFRGLMSLVSADGGQDERIVPAAAIENAVAIIQKKEVPELEDKDALCEFFYAIWGSLKEEGWAELWVAGSKLLKKVGIAAMTTYITDAVISKYDFGDLDISDPDQVRAVVQEILEYQTPDFWKSEWTLKISDAIAVREQIIEALTRIYRNLKSGKEWKADLDFVV
jgi:DGQHR domain-containing protein